MILKGKLVKLRAVEREDMKFLCKMINDSNISAMTIGSCFPVSMEAQNRWYDNFLDKQNELRYIIESVDGYNIGMIVLSEIDWKSRIAEIGIKSISDIKVRKKGDVLEAVKLVLLYAFQEMNLNMVVGNILENNVFSRKLAIDSGFVEEATLRNRIYRHGEYQNIVCYSQTKEEFMKAYNN